MSNSAQLKKRKFTDPEKPNSMSVVNVINRAIKKIVEDENMIMTFKILPCEKVFYEKEEIRTVTNTTTTCNRYNNIVHENTLELSGCGCVGCKVRGVCTKHSGPEPPKVYGLKMVKNATLWPFWALFR